MIEVASPVTAEEKDRAIQEALKDIEKEHGAGSIIEMKNHVVRKIPVIPTRIYNLDHKVLGVGGMPRGRIIEIIGPESSGKTTAALMVVAAAQAGGGRAAFIDVEHALDTTWAAKMDVDVDELLVSQPDYGEQALQIVERLLETHALDIIVVDSVAALVPKAELEGDIGDSHMGLQARLMSQAMRKLTGLVNRSNTTLLFINQIREKIGVMFGSPETTPGGRALKFYASVRLDVRRISTIKEGDVAVGNRVRIKAIKNKVASPYKETEVDLMFDRGFDRFGNLLDAAVASKVVDKAGAWYSYKGDRMGQGRPNAITFMRETELFDTIMGEVVEKEVV